MRKLAAIVAMLAVFHGEHAKADNFEWMRYRAGPEQTIATGAIDPEIRASGPSYILFAVDTEGDAASDDLDTISNPLDGSLIYIRAADAARTVVIKDGTGNIEAIGGDITLDDLHEYAWGFYNSTLAKWLLFGMTDDVGGAELNDLSSVVTWTNVPDANITESSVTQHEAALSIEGTAIISTGEAGGVKYLREDGDGTSSWQTVAAGTGTLSTIKENDVQVGGADIVTLDFLGADFDLTEAPDTEIQVVIADAITRDAEWDTLAKINAATTDDDAVGETRTITVAGTANEIDSTAGAQDLSSNRTWTLDLSDTIDLGAKTSLEIPNGAAPATDAFGEIAADNDAWAASRGAPQFFDGTANVYLIGALASDTPTNGQIPQWNTGGTITWENAGSADNLGDHTATQDLDMNGNDIVQGNSLYLTGKAAAEADVASTGQLWAGTGGNDLMWTIPAGTDRIVAFRSNHLGVFASTSSSQLAGVISDETGSGALVFATSPTLVTPALGTPASGVATNLTGTAAGLTAGGVSPNSVAMVTDTTGNFAASDAEAGAAIAFKVYEEKHAASHTLTNAVSTGETWGSVHYCTAAATLTLPAVADGQSLSVITIGAIAVSVDSNASDLIYLDGVALDDGDKITNTSTAGDIAVFTYYDATGWYAATNGWTDGGP